MMMDIMIIAVLISILDKVIQKMMMTVLILGVLILWCW